MSWLAAVVTLLAALMGPMSGFTAEVAVGISVGLASQNAGMQGVITVTGVGGFLDRHQVCVPMHTIPVLIFCAVHVNSVLFA